MGLSFLGIGSADQNDPKVTEVWDPVPKTVITLPGKAPSDALVLFDGMDMDQWVSSREPSEPSPWEFDEGVLTVEGGAGDIQTKKTFGDCQLHVEWRTPKILKGEGQNRGNSGIFLQERYEIQILDSFNNSTYVNGQAGSLYKQFSPLVNASLKPGEWQTYDILFSAPKFRTNGSLESPGRVTVIHNGVVIQNNVTIAGTTEYVGKPKVIPHGKGAIRLQDHGSPVSFRNIWIREL